jgi:hypothetical protein
MHGTILALTLLFATIANVVALVGHTDPFAMERAAVSATAQSAAAQKI